MLYYLQIVIVSVLPFQFGCCFISFSWLITLARTSNTMLNKRCESGHLYLFIDCKRKPLSFSLSLSYYVRYVPSIPTLWSTFIINWCWILSNTFATSIEVIIQFVHFTLLMWHITLIDLWIMNHHCIPRISPTWSWWMILSMYCWIWFANTLLRIFASVFTRDVGLSFFFLS